MSVAWALWQLYGNPINLAKGLTNLVSGTQSIGFGITTTVAQTWHNGFSGTTVLMPPNSHLRLDANLTLTGPGNFTIRGPITGAGGIISSLRMPEGTILSLQLTNGNNTFTGGIVINDSNRVWVTQYGTAGSGDIIVTNGGQFWLQGASNAAPLYLADRGFAESAGVMGALRMEGGALQRGPVYLTGDARITTYSGDNTIDGPIIGSFAIEKAGTGSLQSANPTNTGFTGRRVVQSNGLLRAVADQALGAVPATPVADFITLTNRARLMNLNNELVLHPNRGISIPTGADSGGGIHAGWWAGIQIHGVISGDGGLYIAADTAPGWVVLAGTNTFRGGLTNDARLRLGADEVIPSGAGASNMILQAQVTCPLHSVDPPGHSIWRATRRRSTASSAAG